VSKKIKKLIKLKKLNHEEKLIKLIRIFLKIFSLIRFYKSETKSQIKSEKKKKPNHIEIKPIKKSKKTSKKQYSFSFLI
jgi:hypothetical protein